MQKHKKNKQTRGRLARKHFSTGAHPAAETPFYIAAASVSARGDAQCVWSHESSISSSYFPLELRRAISHESGLRKLHCSRLLRASCSLQAAARCCTEVLCASCSAPVAPCKRFARVLCVQVALRKCSEQVALRKCSAPVAPCWKIATFEYKRSTRSTPPQLRLENRNVVRGPYSCSSGWKIATFKYRRTMRSVLPQLRLENRNF